MTVAVAVAVPASSALAISAKLQEYRSLLLGSRSPLALMVAGMGLIPPTRATGSALSGKAAAHGVQSPSSHPSSASVSPDPENGERRYLELA